MALARYLVGFVLPSRHLKKGLWRRWYRYFDRKMEGREVRFLNFGMAWPSGEVLEMPPELQEERSSAQLYHRTVSAADLTGKTVLEVSCGRGGGSDYMAGRLGAGLVVGLDQTHSSLAFARRYYSAPNLHFVCGDAMALPFADGAFDAVVNVEASHCYPDVPKFLSEVRRVLRPGGRFLYADFRAERIMGRWTEHLAESGLIKVEEEDITAGVVESLAQTHERRANLMTEIAPRFWRRAFSQFAGTKGSVMYRAFDKRRARYMRFALEKPALINPPAVRSGAGEPADRHPGRP